MNKRDNVIYADFKTKKEINHNEDGTEMLIICNEYKKIQGLNYLDTWILELYYTLDGFFDKYYAVKDKMTKEEIKQMEQLIKNSKIPLQMLHERLEPIKWEIGTKMNNYYIEREKEREKKIAKKKNRGIDLQ